MRILTVCEDSRDVTWGGHVMITDPPYRAHVHEAATSQSIEGGARHRDLGFDHLTEELRLWTCALASKVERWSVIFSDVESVGLWKSGLEQCGATYIRAIPWVRWSMPQLSGDRPPQGHEMIVVAYGQGKGRKHWNGPGNLTHFAHTALRGEGKHKCEKPLDLMLDLADWFSDPGELVIDPFMGSGTTGVACDLLRRNFHGCEQDAEWHRKAESRLLSPLSERDRERAARWLARAKEVDAEKERLAKHTAKVRAKAT